MGKALRVVGLLLFAVLITGTSQEELNQETTDFFTETAKEVTKQIRDKILEVYEKNGQNLKNDEGDGQSYRPELHFSTIRAEASGSGIPSPTMFVGGFSFMMMPTPEGSEMFNKLMGAASSFMPGK